MEIITASQLADLAGVTRQAIHDAIEHGHFPGARKLDPDRETSPYLIPLDQAKAWMKKRAQTEKA